MLKGNTRIEIIEKSATRDNLGNTTTLSEVQLAMLDHSQSLLALGRFTSDSFGDNILKSLGRNKIYIESFIESCSDMRMVRAPE